MKKIELVNQVDDKTCASACISMLTGMPIDKVIEEFHGDYLALNIDIGDYLRSKGFVVRDAYSKERLLKPGSVYLLCVPSLNVVGGLHEVVVDIRDVFEIYDPQAGRKDKKYYVYGVGLYDDPLAVEFKGYVIDAEIENF